MEKWAQRVERDTDNTFLQKLISDFLAEFYIKM